MRLQFLFAAHLSAVFLLLLTAGPSEAQTVNPANNHTYQFINIGSTWTDAQAAASSMTYRGRTGHLVTIADAAENSFVLTLLPGDAGSAVWIGATETGGTLSWVTGEPVTYTNWGVNQPSTESEMWVEIESDIGLWNDNGNGAGRKYVVEWDTEPGDPPPGETPPAVPEPGALVLFLPALALLALLHRRRCAVIQGE